MADNQALLMNTDDEDEGLGFGEEGPEAKLRLRQPVVAFFHVAFRAAAILVYILCGGSGFIASFTAVLVLLALDFWTVKNITGRKLVGLRWTNFVDDNGQSHWIFEGRKGSRAGGRPPERRIFWTALIVAPIVWIFLFFFAFFTFRFQWSILVILAILLNVANLYGYIRCKLGHQPGIADASSVLGTGITSLIFRTASAIPTMGKSDANSAANAFSQQV